MADPTAVSPAVLPATVSGPPDDPRPPVVLIHGFAGDALAWAAVQPRLDPTRRVIAFDLPGHGRARDWPERGNARIAAKAVARSLDGLGIARAHLVGHSMGGAIAALLAIKTPERVASLVLVSPGGFGPEINARLLRRFARAVTEAELAPVVDGFFGFRSEIPPDLLPLMAKMRADPVLIERFVEIGEAILDGNAQKTLPLDALAALPAPARLVWGTEDGVVPVHQAVAAPEIFARHILSGVGHLPHVERSGLVIRLIGETVASGEA